MLVSIDSIPRGGKLPSADSEKAKAGDLSLFNKAIDAKNNEQHEKDADIDSSTPSPLESSAKLLLPDHSSVAERIAGEHVDSKSNDLLPGNPADYIDDLLVLDDSAEVVAPEADNSVEPATAFKTEGFGIMPEGFGRMANGAFSGPPEIISPVQSAKSEQSVDAEVAADAENERTKAASKPEPPEPIGTFSNDAIATFLSGSGGGNDAYGAFGL